MGDIPADLGDRIDAAMSEGGFSVAAEQPWFNKTQQFAPPHVFHREYDYGGFKYLVTISASDIARHGVDTLIAMKVKGSLGSLKRYTETR